jgi:hypothetical protein
VRPTACGFSKGTRARKVVAFDRPSNPVLERGPPMCRHYSSHLRPLFGAALALAALAALAACGGSSSETPPPLQPDPNGFRYAPAFPARAAEESDAGDAPRTSPDLAEVEANPKPRVPARSTWGAAPAR